MDFLKKSDNEKGLTAEQVHDRIVGGHIHNTLVFLQYFVPLPFSIILAMVLTMGLLAIMVWLPRAVSIFGIYLIFALSDLVILKKLPGKRITFAPIAPPFLIFAMGRAATILICGLLPLSWWVRILLAGIIQVILSACAFWGMIIEPFRIQLTRINISSPKLQKSGEPLTILQLSDLHIERITKREETIVQLTNELQPDLIVITGDFLSLTFAKDPAAIRDTILFLRQLSAPCGVYAIRGSFFVDLPSIVPAMLKDAGVVLLEKDFRLISHKGHEFCLAGLPSSKHPITDRPVLDELMQRIREDHFTILLYHSPDLIPDAAGRVDLYLGGHTHGGQVCFPLLGPFLSSSMYGRKYIAGRYEMEGTTAYISRGLGMEGLGAPRIRFLCPPEMVFITLGS